MKLHFSYKSPPLPFWPLWRLKGEGLREEEQLGDKKKYLGGLLFILAEFD